MIGSLAWPEEADKVWGIGMMDNFWTGFEKRAGEGLLMGLTMGGGMIGGLGAGIAASKYYGKQNAKLLRKIQRHKEKVDAKEFFKTIQHFSPNAKLITIKELEQLIRDEDDKVRKEFLKGLRSVVTGGNAAAIHPYVIERERLGHLVPDSIKAQPVILTAEKVNPSVIAHEMGHVIDYDIVAQQNFLKKFLANRRSTLKVEHAAWEKAPGSGHDEVKETALQTYKNSKKVDILMNLGTIAGVAAGAGLGFLAKKKFG